MTIEELSKLSDEELRVKVAEKMKLHLSWARYFSTLDGMYDAEKTLTREQCDKFNSALMDVKPPRSEMECEAEKWSWHATARQRAIAFLSV